MRVGAIDCGTNSIRLLVADITDGTVIDLDRRMEIVRLGQGVDRTGRMAPEAIARTLAAARRYGQICADLGVRRLRFIATSATRDAANRGEFVAGVRDALGVEPEVVAGAEEALLSFRGATSRLAEHHRGPFLVVDIGGGSTELVLGTADPEAVDSIDVGCVRITERFLRSDPPVDREVTAAREHVRAALAGAAIPVQRTATLVGLAGSVTTVTAHALGLDRYDPERIDGAELTADVVLATAADLLRMPHAERAALPFMHPGRVDVIGAGALVWSEVVEMVTSAAGQVPVVTSEHDILDGIALSVAD